LGLYSRRIKSVSEFKTGDRIAIPNDPTNGGRSLKVLESAGLIGVNPDVGYLPSLRDITDNPLNLQFIEVEAAMTASLLPDVAAAIINGQHAADRGLNPKRDAIYVETQSEGGGNPYVNLIAARTAEKDNPVYKRVVEVYRSDEIRNVIDTVYNGLFVPVF
jgi:D-methionine transport system substrate-binding protein